MTAQYDGNAARLLRMVVVLLLLLLFTAPAPFLASRFVGGATCSTNDRDEWRY